MDHVDYYCAAPFRHIAVDNIAPDRYRPCCVWQGTSQPAQVSAAAAFDSDHMQQLRLDMQANRKNPGCAICHGHDQSSGDSLRQSFNRLYDRPIEPQLRDIEFNLGNLCNMRCRMCTSSSSSRWQADDKRLGRTSHPLVRRTAADLNVDLAQLDRIKFIGGEITLEQDEVIAVLQGIDLARGGLSHLSVEIITNGMLLLQQEVIDLLLQCRHVDVVISLDGMQASNDYQRSEGKWSEIVAAARYYDALANGRFCPGIISTISCLTVADAPELMDFVTCELPGSWHVINALLWPAELSVRNMPDPYKQQIKQQLESWIPRLDKSRHQEWRGRILQDMAAPQDTDIVSVRKMLQELDDLRGETLQQCLPDLYSAYFS